MSEHTCRTRIVYQLARDAALRGELDLKENVFRARCGFVCVLMNHDTGRVLVYSSEPAASFFHGTLESCDHCAPTEFPGRLDDEPRTWLNELKQANRRAA